MRVLLLVITLLISLNSFAQSARGDYFLLGAGTAIKQNNRIGNNLTNYDGPIVVAPYPLVSAKVGRLKISGHSASYMFGGGPFALGAKIKWQGDPYRTQHIEHRRSSFFGGISGRLLFMSFSYMADLNNKSQGQVAEVSLLQRVVWGEKLFQVFKMGREFYNHKYVNYYYGVKQSEGVDLNQYSARSSWNNFATLGNHIKFSDRFRGMLTFKYKYFGDEVYHSPTTRRRTMWLSALMLHYRF